MLRLFSRKQPEAPAIDVSAAAAALSRYRMSEQQAKQRAMTNRLRSDLRAKGKDLPPIDWSKL